MERQRDRWKKGGRKGKERKKNLIQVGSKELRRLHDKAGAER